LAARDDMWGRGVILGAVGGETGRHDTAFVLHGVSRADCLVGGRLLLTAERMLKAAGIENRLCGHAPRSIVNGYPRPLADLLEHQRAIDGARMIAADQHPDRQT